MISGPGHFSDTRIFDTHSHYDDRAFDNDRDEIFAAFEQAGVGFVTDVSSDTDSIAKVLELIHNYPFIFGTAGIHPSELEDMSEDWMEVIRKTAAEPKITAIGEIGLDYHYDDGPDRETQKYWFDRQMALALELDMPVVIHSRDAAEDTLEIVRKYAERGLKGVIHCFSYSSQIAELYVKMGFFIGVGGVVTYKNGRKLKETVEKIPLESIVLETDCPYLSPEPFRGKRNSSVHLPYVVNAITELKNTEPQEVVRQTFYNALQLYPKAADYLRQAGQTGNGYGQ